MLVLVPLDMNKNEIRNALVHVLAADPSSPVEGQIYYNSVSKTLRYYTGAAWIVLGTLDQISAPVASVSMNNQRVVSVAAPVASGDAANKLYVDNLVQGLAWKDSVRAATTVAGTLASSFANGQVIDGVSLNTGERILIKNQAAPAENGIYTVNASGAPTRAIDADANAELPSATVLVEEGTTQADTIWTCSTNTVITLGTTALTFVQVGAGTAVSGGAGLTLTANVMAVGAGTGITVNADDVALTVPVAVANGGTGATTAAAALTALGGVRKLGGLYGTGAATSFSINHLLGTNDIHVQVFDAASGALVIADVVQTTVNNVNVSFAVAPATNGVRIVIMG